MCKRVRDFSNREKKGKVEYRVIQDQIVKLVYLSWIMGLEVFQMMVYFNSENFGFFVEYFYLILRLFFSVYGIEGVNLYSYLLFKL